MDLTPHDMHRLHFKEMSSALAMLSACRLVLLRQECCLLPPCLERLREIAGHQPLQLAWIATACRSSGGDRRWGIEMGLGRLLDRASSYPIQWVCHFGRSCVVTDIDAVCAYIGEGRLRVHKTDNFKFCLEGFVPQHFCRTLPSHLPQGASPRRTCRGPLPVSDGRSSQEPVS